MADGGKRYGDFRIDIKNYQRLITQNYLTLPAKHSATVYVQDLACNKTCEWTSEKENCVCNFYRLRYATEWNCAKYFFTLRLVLQGIVHHIGIDPTWCYTIHANASCCEFGCE